MKVYILMCSNNDIIWSIKVFKNEKDALNEQYKLLNQKEYDDYWVEEHELL